MPGRGKARGPKQTALEQGSALMNEGLTDLDERIGAVMKKTRQAEYVKVLEMDRKEVQRARDVMGRIGRMATSVEHMVHSFELREAAAAEAPKPARSATPPAGGQATQ